MLAQSEVDALIFSEIYTRLVEEHPSAEYATTCEGQGLFLESVRCAVKAKIDPSCWPMLGVSRPDDGA